jgi:anti-anti-sigma regulatory factor
MNTSTTATLLEIDPHRVAGCLRELHAQLDTANGEMVLDFSSVRRIDAQAVRALEELASLAEAKAVKIALRDVNVDIYKVLKLVKLALRFSLLT